MTQNKILFNIVLLYLFIFFSFILFSCKKKESINTETIQYIRIINLTNEFIDTLKIIHETNNFPQETLWGDIRMFFNQIEINDTTDFVSAKNLIKSVYFVGIIKSVTYVSEWDSPHTELIDNEGFLQEVMSKGHYTFSVNSFDTINNTLEIELNDYYD